MPLEKLTNQTLTPGVYYLLTQEPGQYVADEYYIGKFIQKIGNKYEFEVELYGPTSSTPIGNDEDEENPGTEPEPFTEQINPNTDYYLTIGTKEDADKMVERITNGESVTVSEETTEPEATNPVTVPTTEEDQFQELIDDADAQLKKLDEQIAALQRQREALVAKQATPSEPDTENPQGGNRVDKYVGSGVPPPPPPPQPPKKPTKPSGGKKTNKRNKKHNVTRRRK